MSDPWEEVDYPCGIYCTRQCMLISNYVNINFSVQMVLFLLQVCWYMCI